MSKEVSKEVSKGPEDGAGVGAETEVEAAATSESASEPAAEAETTSTTKSKSASGIVINFVRGFCMALADSVPGVSGGTIAFLLGFYDRFIASIDDLFHGTKETRIAAVKFLLKIGIGWVVGFCLSAIVLTSLFETHIYAVSSLFMGLIVFAIPTVIIEEKSTLKDRPIGIPFLILGIVVVVAITMINPVADSGIDVSVSGLTPWLVVYVIIAGMVAISAMVLPGMSGSTLLLIFGLYIPIMGAVRSVLSLDFSYLPVLLLFVVGVLLGAILFVRLIRLALQRFRAQTICLIIGMMIGSLYAITQGPLTLDDPMPAMTLQTFSVLFFIIGGAIVAVLQLLKMHLKDPEETPAEPAA